MQGMEQAYDFHELLGCANTINHLAGIEYGDNGLKFIRQHNKQKNIWGTIHPLAEGQHPIDLGDYSNICTNNDLILALKQGLREAQSFL
jgi:hypothetical protein